MTRALLHASMLALSLGGCAAAPKTLGENARASLPPDGRLLVVTFFSASCPCQRAHDPRLVDLAKRYQPRGVRLVIVDVSPDATEASDQAEASARGYPVPILRDGGGLADDLGAEYATYTVVLDGEGRVRYAGGLDSDRTDLTPDARMFVADALDQLLAGKEPKITEGKTLGCVLRRR